MALSSHPYHMLCVCLQQPSSNLNTVRKSLQDFHLQVLWYTISPPMGLDLCSCGENKSHVPAQSSWFRACMDAWALPLLHSYSINIFNICASGQCFLLKLPPLLRTK